jgi:hypothetical protein
MQNIKFHVQIKRNGEIVSDRQWLTYNQTKETKSHMKDLLTQAVVHKGKFNNILIYNLSYNSGVSLA